MAQRFPQIGNKDYQEYNFTYDGFAHTGQGVLGTNMFAYCNNNPVMNVDCTGTKCHIFDGGRYGPECPTDATGFCLVHHKQDCCMLPGTSKVLNSDDSYSLYDNRRNGTSSKVFHEQILSASASGPSFGDGNIALGSVDISLMNGGWDWKYGSFYPLNFGMAELSGGYEDGNFKVGAMASVWNPSATLKIWDSEITIALNVGSIGAKFGVTDSGIEFGAGFGAGVSISIR